MIATSPKNQLVYTNAYIFRYLELKVQNRDAAVNNYKVLVDIVLTVMNLLSRHRCVGGFNRKFIGRTIELDLVAKTVELVLNFPLGGIR